MDALVRVYFHSSSNKYNRMECWGPLKDAALVYSCSFKLVWNERMLVIIFVWEWCCFAGERSGHDKWLLVCKQGNVTCSQVLGEPKIDLSSTRHLPAVRRRWGWRRGRRLNQWDFATYWVEFHTSRNCFQRSFDSSVCNLFRWFLDCQFLFKERLFAHFKPKLFKNQDYASILELWKETSKFKQEVSNSSTLQLRYKWKV